MLRWRQPYKSAKKSYFWPTAHRVPPANIRYTPPDCVISHIQNFNFQNDRALEQLTLVLRGSCWLLRFTQSSRVRCPWYCRAGRPCQRGWRGYTAFRGVTTEAQNALINQTLYQSSCSLIQITGRKRYLPVLPVPGSNASSSL